MSLPDVVHQFQKGKVVPDEPNEIRQEDHDSSEGSQPYPTSLEYAALRGRYYTNEHTKRKEDHRVFVFQTESNKNTKPQPVALIAAVHAAHDAIGAAHPEE